MSKVTEVTQILGEKHARKIVDAAVEDIALVREWVFENRLATLPADGSTPPETRHLAEAYGAYCAWQAILDAAIGVLDAKAADMFGPKNEDERQAMLKRIDDFRAQIAKQR
jgi:hypothetical protein